MLLDACRQYPLRPREYFTFEYVLLGGVNDTPEDARRVVRLLAHIRAKVNLIPWNPGNLPYRAPTAGEHRGISAHSRRERRARVRALFARTGCLRRLRPARADGNAEPACCAAVAERASACSLAEFWRCRIAAKVQKQQAEACSTYDSNHRHHPPGLRAFAAIAEQQIRAARGAQIAHVDLLFRHAGIDQLPAIRRRADRVARAAAEARAPAASSSATEARAALRRAPVARTGRRTSPPRWEIAPRTPARLRGRLRSSSGRSPARAPRPHRAGCVPNSMRIRPSVFTAMRASVPRQPA